jgi:uncharacterized Ntn-hydrolase superfamily protein
MLVWLAVASATWSIVAVDPDTEEVGIAGATCSPMVWFIGGIAPGHGVVAAQYATSLPHKADVVDAVVGGAVPAEALAAGLEGDDKVALRQWAVVGLNGPPATFVGEEVELPARVTTGETWSAQGNTLASEAVVDDAGAAFVDAQGALAERLLAALEAGAAAGGDSRCDPADAARSAFLYVAAPGDDARDPTVELRASGAGAVAELRPRLEAADNSCSQGGGRRWWPWLALLLMRRRA